MKSVCLVLVAFSVGLALSRAQETYRVETNQSMIQIQVGTSGLLGSMGHSHLVQTPVKQGTFVYYPADPAKSSVELEVDAGALQVMDPKLSAKDKTQIQAKMQSDHVLGTRQHPAIVFKSTTVEALDRTHLRVTGDLTIRDQTHAVIVQVALEPAAPQLKATGTCQFKQTTFAIQPVAVALGTVRVKDELEISFNVIFHN
jgi:polyisoprenoid-binding protein YceI